MVRRIVFPPEERIDSPIRDNPSSDSIIFNIYNNKEKDEFLEKVGSLEKSAFSELTPWRSISLCTGENIGFRVGIKNNISTSEGESVNYVMYFYNTFDMRGNELPNNVKEKSFKLTSYVLLNSYLDVSKKIEGASLYFTIPAPKWMEVEWINWINLNRKKDLNRKRDKGYRG